MDVQGNISIKNETFDHVKEENFYDDSFEQNFSRDEREVSLEKIGLNSCIKL